MHAFLRDDLTRFCRPAPSDFTNQQRAVFCVFSGEGVSQLRDYLNEILSPYQGGGEVTMYDDDDELDEDEGQVTGLMHATAISDEDYIDVGPPHG